MNTCRRPPELRTRRLTNEHQTKGSSVGGVGDADPIAGDTQIDEAVTSLRTLIWIAEHRRRLQEIKQDLEEMSKLTDTAITQPWNASIRLRLAAICAKLDLHDEAAMWQKAAAACPRPAPGNERTAP